MLLTQNIAAQQSDDRLRPAPPQLDLPLRPKLRALTTLRFLAALHVVLFHMHVTGILKGGPWWYLNFVSIGYIGVNCFFVLSGFILVYTYADDPSLNQLKFWRSRFARIYPAYVLSLLVSAPSFFFALRHLDLPFFAWTKEHLWVASVLTVTLLQSWHPQAALTWNSVCWSLSVEAFFYLVFPLLLICTRRLGRQSLLVSIAAASFISLALSVLYILLHPDGAAKINSGETTLFWKNVLSFNPVARLPEFVVGVFAGRLFLMGKRDSRLAGPLIFGGVLLLAVLTTVVGKIPTPLISAGFLSPAFAAIIFGLALQPKWSSFLELPALVALGDASYSLYLLHSTVISKAFEAMSSGPRLLAIVVSFLAAISASLLSFYLVEEPARKFLRPKGKR